MKAAKGQDFSICGKLCSVDHSGFREHLHPDQER
jgi:hypothetical protein